MCVNDMCVIKLIGWKMDGWIGLSGCGCGKWRGSGSHTCTVSKLWLIIRQIFASERKVPHFSAIAWGDSLSISP